MFLLGKSRQHAELLSKRMKIYALKILSFNGGEIVFSVKKGNCVDAITRLKKLIIKPIQCVHHSVDQFANENF